MKGMPVPNSKFLGTVIFTVWFSFIYLRCGVWFSLYMDVFALWSLVFLLYGYIYVVESGFFYMDIFATDVKEI